VDYLVRRPELRAFIQNVLAFVTENPLRRLHPLVRIIEAHAAYLSVADFLPKRQWEEKSKELLRQGF
jgi:hypothetical protein